MQNELAVFDGLVCSTFFSPGFISEFEEPIEPMLAPLIQAISNCPAVHRGAKTKE